MGKRCFGNNEDSVVDCTIVQAVDKFPINRTRKNRAANKFVLTNFRKYFKTLAVLSDNL